MKPGKHRDRNHSENDRSRNERPFFTRAASPPPRLEQKSEKLEQPQWTGNCALDVLDAKAVDKAVKGEMQVCNHYG